MLTKYDIGKLKHGVRVKVKDRTGTVIHEHEPQWRDHKTKAWMHELQGADITFDDEPGHTRYIHCDQIEILPEDQRKEPTSPGRWIAVSPTGERHQLTVEQCMDFHKGPLLCVLCPNGWRTSASNFIGWLWLGPLSEDQDHRPMPESTVTTQKETNE